MPFQSDIGVASVFAGQFEPVDEFFGDLAGLQRVQHLDPGGQDDLGTPIDAARRRRQPRLGIRLKVAVLSSIFLRSSRASLASGSAMRLRPRDSSAHRLQKLFAHGMGFSFQRVESIGVAAARAHMGIGEAEKDFARSPRCGAQSLRPAFARQRGSGLHRILQRVLRGFVVGDQVLQPLVQAAHAGAGARLGAANPAAQLRHLPPRQAGGKAAVGGVEQMMAFVEDIAQAAAFLGRVGGLVHAQPVLRGLRDHQRMVGDHDIGVAGAADGALDETEAVMRAGGIDAFAAPVGDGG